VSPSTRRATQALDVLTVAACLSVIVAISFEVSGVARVVAALVLVMFAPGWAAVRTGGARLSILTIACAIGLSLGVTMIFSTVLVTWLDWQWRPLAVFLAIASGVGIAAVPRMAGQPDGTASIAVATDHSGVDDASRRAWIALGCTLGGAAVSAAAMARASVDDIGELGLVQALPIWFFAGPAAILVGLFVGLARLRTVWFHLTALVVVLHGLPGFVEPLPRFPTAWLHVGFADQIATNGELLPLLDARFSWPGFFAGAAFLMRTAGTDDLFWILRFAPIAINLLAVAAVYSLARSLGTSERRSIVACAIYVVGNWIGQDYFAPQAVLFVITTLVLAIVLRFWDHQPEADHWTARHLGGPSPDMVDGSTTVTPGQLVAIRLGAGVAAIAIVMSHQISPPIFILSLLGLWMVRRMQTINFAVAVSLFFVGWLSFAAEAYWLGHLDTLFNSIGNVSSVVESNVSERSATGTEGREIVVRSRLAFMAVIWLGALWAMLAQRRRRVLDPAVPVLFFAPFVMMLLQPYGGEMLLRVALFSLPISSILISRWVEDPRPARVRGPLDRATVRPPETAELADADADADADIDADIVAEFEIVAEFDDDFDFDWFDREIANFDFDDEALQAIDIFDDEILGLGGLATSDIRAAGSTSDSSTRATGGLDLVEVVERLDEPGGTPNPATDDANETPDVDLLADHDIDHDDDDHDDIDRDDIDDDGDGEIDRGTEADQNGRGGRRRLIYALGLIAVLPVFAIARFGNETYERVSIDDRDVAEVLYTTAGDDTVVFTFNRHALIYLDRLDDIRFRNLPMTTVDAGLAEMRNAARSGREVYTLLSDGQASREEQVTGRPDGWIVGFATEIAAEPDAEIVFRSGDSFLIRVGVPS